MILYVRPRVLHVKPAWPKTTLFFKFIYCCYCHVFLSYYQFFLTSLKTQSYPKHFSFGVEKSEKLWHGLQCTSHGPLMC